MPLKKRLLRVMRRHNMRVADLARHLGWPYTTVREWVLHDRLPLLNARNDIEHKLRALER